LRKTAEETAAVALAFGKAAFVALQAIFRTVPDIAGLYMRIHVRFAIVSILLL
jgi:hypothetical protein